MTGGLIQLVAYGVQDMYLTKEPQITFFKTVYRRHTNFSVEVIPQPFIHKAEFGKKITCTISKSGDLLEKVYLVVTLPKVPEIVDESGKVDNIFKFAWAERIGFTIINKIEIEIGGQIIDRHYGEWLNILYELYGPRTNGYDKMIGNVPELTSFSNGKKEYKLFIPLQFWFCKFSNSALPLVNLKYNDVKIHVEFNSLDQCHVISPSHYIETEQDIVNFEPNEFIEQNVDGQIAHGRYIHHDFLTKRMYYLRQSRNKFKSIQETEQILNDLAIEKIINMPKNSKYLIKGVRSGFETFSRINSIEKAHTTTQLKYLEIKDCFLLANFIFLDEDERSRFVQKQHDYLIEHTFINTEKVIESTNANIKIEANHPCKQITWVTNIDYYRDKTMNDHYNYTDHYVKHKGKNLIEKTTVLYNGHERIRFRDSKYFNLIQPYQSSPYSPNEGIYAYLFSINPNDFQPSGSCNFSKIDNITIQITMNQAINIHNPAKLRCYITSYNILRVSNGISSLLFIN
jgi:hypothetical protein